MHVGAAVEVLAADEAFQGSWSTATVLQKDELNGTLKVSYNEFVTEDGQQLQEDVEASRVRPVPPATLAFASFSGIQVGYSVECYDEDAWWRGIVVETLTGGVQVKFPESNRRPMVVRSLNALRPAYVLLDDVWQRHVPFKPMLQRCNVPKAQQERVLEELQLVPTYNLDGTLRAASRGGGHASSSGQAPPSAALAAHHHLRTLPLARSAGAANGSDAHSGTYSGAGNGAGGLYNATINGAGGGGADNGAGSGAAPYNPYSNAGAAHQLASMNAAMANMHAAMASSGAGGGSGGAAPPSRLPYAGLNLPFSNILSGGASGGAGGLPGLLGTGNWWQNPAISGGANGAMAAAMAAAASAAAAGAMANRVANQQQQQQQPQQQPLGDGMRAAGKRQVKNRLVYVDGNPVLKSNMYDLQSGEPSVFDKELSSTKGTNMYLNMMNGVSLTAPPAPRPYVPPPRLSPAPQQQRQVPLVQSQRQKHNDEIRRETQRMEPIRALYLLQHLEKLRAFISPAAATGIERRAQLAPPGWKPPEPITGQPAIVRGQMREYQVEGLQFLVSKYDHGTNAILADEMGLGKTLQTIAFLAYLKFERKVEGPHLVVVPLSVLGNWTQEFKRWCPEMRVVRLHTSDPNERVRLRKEVLGEPSSFDVAVTTYDMVNSQHFGDALKHTIMWRYLVLDEGHRVKNEETLISHGMRLISRQQVIMLTGTPVQNNLHELYALLNFMYPDVFTDGQLFDTAFDLVANKVDNAKLTAAHYLLRPFLLRRIKDEVECKLPPKLETRINCPLSEMQTFWYRRLLMRDCQLLDSLEDQARADAKVKFQGEGGNSWKKLANLLMQLRKVCNHPFMMPDAEPEFDGTSTGEEVVQASGKMQVLDKLLGKLKERGHRVVLFSQFKMMLDVIEDYLLLRGYKYRRLDGSTNRIQRVIDIESFNKPNSDIFIYILCTRAGGLGVNLQTADTCIMFDSDWNPQQDLQAMARVHRIGQTKPVHIYRMCAEGTVEDRIQRRAETKLYLDQMVNRGSTHGAEELEGLSTKEVLSMLKFGADRIFKNKEGRMLTDAELDALLDRSHMMAATAAAGHAVTEIALPIKCNPEEESATAAAVAAALRESGTGEAGPSGTGGIDNGGATAGPGSGASAAADGAAGPGGSGGNAGADGTATEAGGTVAGAGGTEAAAAAGPSGVKVEGAAATVKAGEDAAAQPSELMAFKQSALDFNAEQLPLSTYMLAGQDYSYVKSLKGENLRDIGRQFWAEKKRERKERLVTIDGYAVLKENNYTMEEGGISACAKQTSQPKRSQRQTAGDDYEHMDTCQVCWDGGSLICCDWCPCSFHPECIGINMDDVEGMTWWSCPHHQCHVCERKTAAAGGLLFRCEMCEKAYCEDHLPQEHTMAGECAHFQALGQRHPKQACFVQCSQQCKDAVATRQPIIDRILRGERTSTPLEYNIRSQKKAAAAAAAAAATAASQAAALAAGKKIRGKRRASEPAEPPVTAREAKRTLRASGSGASAHSSGGSRSQRLAARRGGAADGSGGGGGGGADSGGDE